MPKSAAACANKGGCVDQAHAASAGTRTDPYRSLAIPWCGVKALESSAKLLHFTLRKNPESFWSTFSKKLANFWQHCKKKGGEQSAVKKKTLSAICNKKLRSDHGVNVVVFRVFLRFDSKRCNGVHCVDLDESFSLSI